MESCSLYLILCGESTQRGFIPAARSRKGPSQSSFLKNLTSIKKYHKVRASRSGSVVLTLPVPVAADAAKVFFPIRLGRRLGHRVLNTKVSVESLRIDRLRHGTSIAGAVIQSRQMQCIGVYVPGRPECFLVIPSRDLGIKNGVGTGYPIMRRLQTT